MANPVWFETPYLLDGGPIFIEKIWRTAIQAKADAEMFQLIATPRVITSVQYNPSRFRA